MSGLLYQLQLIFTLMAPLLSTFDVKEEFLNDEMLCRKCGHGITSVEHFASVPTKHALRQRNDTISTRTTLIQLFENPQGAKFEVLTVKNADVKIIGEPTEEYTWFKGFTWRIAVCPQCGLHLGWKYEPVDMHESGSSFSFIALILSHLIGSSYADSLLITPKAYQS